MHHLCHPSVSILCLIFNCWWIVGNQQHDFVTEYEIQRIWGAKEYGLVYKGAQTPGPEFRSLASM